MTLPDDYEQCGEYGFDHEYARIYELTSELEIIGTFRAKLIIAVTDQDELEVAAEMGLELTTPCVWETLASYCYAADVREYITRQHASGVS